MFYVYRRSEERRKVLELLSVFASRTRLSKENEIMEEQSFLFFRNCLHFKIFLRRLRFSSGESLREIGKCKRNNFPVCSEIGKSACVKWFLSSFFVCLSFMLRGNPKKRSVMLENNLLMNLFANFPRKRFLSTFTEQEGSAARKKLS